MWKGLATPLIVIVIAIAIASARFLYTQRLGEVAKPDVLGSSMNLTDVSDSNNISTPPTYPANHE